MYKKDSHSFFSTRVVCRSSDTSHNSTGYVAIDYKIFGFVLSCTQHTYVHVHVDVVDVMLHSRARVVHARVHGALVHGTW